ncbi:hypothetical protein HRG_012232 [Hirsutella rhossiliensis]
MTLFPVDGREPGRLRTDPSATQRLQTCHHYAMEAKISSYAAPTIPLFAPRQTCLKVNFSKCSASYSQQLKRDSLMVVGTPIVFSHDAVPSPHFFSSVSSLDRCQFLQVFSVLPSAAEARSVTWKAV